MEKLSVEKRTGVSKTSTERLRAKLIKAGYDEDDVFEMDRIELLSTYAEYLLSRPLPESPEKAAGGAPGAVPPAAGMSAEEWEFRKQELEIHLVNKCILTRKSRALFHRKVNSIYPWFLVQQLR